MNRYELTVGLEGGLGNRMRAAAAAAALSQQLTGDVVALWTLQWGMECRFDDLFCPCCMERFELRDATTAECFFAARPRPRNLHLSRLLHKLCYDSAIYSDQVRTLCNQDFDFAAWARGRHVLLWTWLDFVPWDTVSLTDLFRPKLDIIAAIDERCAAFTKNTIGVHIRRTDHVQSITESPIELFFDALDNEVSRHDDTSIYLATDDEATKVAISQRYGKRVLTSPRAATRDTVSGIQDALVEMAALSRTAKVYGSAGSTFSEMATRWGNIPLIVLKH